MWDVYIESWGSVNNKPHSVVEDEAATGDVVREAEERWRVGMDAGSPGLEGRTARAVVDLFGGPLRVELDLVAEAMRRGRGRMGMLG